MKRNNILSIFLCGVFIIGSVVTVEYLANVYREVVRLNRIGTELEQQAISLPLGISAEEVSTRFRALPDETGKITGILINPSTMLAKENPLASNRGNPTTYRSEKWTRGSKTVVVVYDDDDLVAGRWAFPALKNK